MDERLQGQPEKDSQNWADIETVGSDEEVVASIFDILDLVTVCPHCSTKNHIIKLEDGRCQSCGFVPELDMDEMHMREFGKIASFIDDGSDVDEYFQTVQLRDIKGIHKVSYKMHEITPPKLLSDQETLKRKLVIDYEIVKMLSHRTQKKSSIKLRVEYEVIEKIVQRDLFDGVERNSRSFQQLVACNIVWVYRNSDAWLKKVQMQELYEWVSTAIKQAGKQIMETYIKNS